MNGKINLSKIKYIGFLICLIGLFMITNAPTTSAHYQIGYVAFLIGAIIAAIGIYVSD